jgi:colanic acid/amylovoran biosynthesis glycosyltransferase
VTPAASPDRRVVHLVNDYLGYSQTWVHPQLSVAGFESHVVARRLLPGALERFPHPRVTALARRFPVRAALNLLRDPRDLRHVCTLAAELIREIDPHLVHAHFGHYGWRFLEAARRAGRPYVVSFYGRDMSMMPREARWRRRYAELFADAAVVVCLGNFMAAEMVRIGCPPGKIRMLPIGADLSLCRYAPRALAPGEPLRILAAARFTEKKGLPDAIRAAGLAAREVPLELLVVGAAASDREGRREERRIRAAVAASGLGGRVRFLGSLPMPRLLEAAAGCHVLLHPSRRASDGDHEGGYPVICIELAATGMASVATRHADMDMVVKDGETGLLADEGDAAGLARHLVRLAREPGLVAAMGRAAHALATREFDVRQYQQRLAAVYREALSPGAGGAP